MESGIQDDNFSDDKDTNGDKAERSDLSQNLLQVTGGFIVLADKSGSATEESVGTGGNDDTFGFTLFAGGTTELRDVKQYKKAFHLISFNSKNLTEKHAREALIANFLALRKRFTSKRCLVNGDVNGLGQPAISWDNVANLESNHITRGEVG